MIIQQDGLLNMRLLDCLLYQDLSKIKSIKISDIDCFLGETNSQIIIDDIQSVLNRPFFAVTLTSYTFVSFYDESMNQIESVSGHFMDNNQ